MRGRALLGDRWRGVLFGTTRRIRGLDFTWWGWAEAHKWRWNLTHIDLGPLSIYGIAQPPNRRWRLLAGAVWPLRWWYNRYRAQPWVRNVLRSPNAHGGQP